MSITPSPYFTIAVEQTSPTIIITMHIQKDDVTTTHMPHVSTILQQELPTILRSRCFNEKNVPFYKEVVSTELGHLFEHILLEYLCMAKIKVGYKEAIFSGVTKWDWNKDPYGMFHIELDMQQEDVMFLRLALEQTVRLFEKILIYHPSVKVFHSNKTTGNRPVPRSVSLQ